MQDETAEDRPLKQAISAMRTALDSAIGEELDRLLAEHPPTASEGDVQERCAGTREPAAWRVSPLRDSVEPSDQTEPRPSSPPPSAVDHPERSTSISAGEPDSNDSDAIERRLDALAHRLEGRLRRTRDREPHRPQSDDGSSPDPNRA